MSGAKQTSMTFSGNQILWRHGGYPKHEMKLVLLCRALSTMPHPHDEHFITCSGNAPIAMFVLFSTIAGWVLRYLLSISSNLFAWKKPRAESFLPHRFFKLRLTFLQNLMITTPSTCALNAFFDPFKKCLLFKLQLNSK